MATFYLLPYFDLGVRLDADGKGGVDQICGSVHFLQPGRSSLLTRRLYTTEQLAAAALKRHAPKSYADRLRAGYLRGVDEDRPAVNSVNMFFSALGVLDFLARLHGYRDDPNSGFAAQTISLTGSFWLRLPEAEWPVDEPLAKYIGRGDMRPMMGRPFLDMAGHEK